MGYIGQTPTAIPLDGDDLSDDILNSQHYVDGSIDLAHMSSQSVDEDNLHISNAGSNGQFLSKQSGDAGGLTWATVSTGTNGWVFLSETVASNSATISITSNITSTYDQYVVVITDLNPATDDTELRMLLSTDGGSSYRNSSSNYRQSIMQYGVGGATDHYTDSSQDHLKICYGSGSNESLQSGDRGVQVMVYISNPSDTAEKTHLSWSGSYHSAGNEQQCFVGGGCYNAGAEDVDAVRFQMESGNISTGNFALYGLSNS